MQAREESLTLPRASGQEISPEDEKKCYGCNKKFGTLQPEVVFCESMQLEKDKLGTDLLRSLTNVQTAPDITMKPLIDHVDMAADATIASIQREAF